MYCSNEIAFQGQDQKTPSSGFLHKIIDMVSWEWIFYLRPEGQIFIKQNLHCLIVVAAILQTSDGTIILLPVRAIPI